MVSYWKTQWFRFAIGCTFLILTIYCMFQPAADESTLEGVCQNLNTGCQSLCYFISSMIWFIASYIEYNNDRIKLLEKKAEKYDALCENVKALNEANRIDREHMKLLEMKIEQIKYDRENPV